MRDQIVGGFLEDVVILFFLGPQKEIEKSRKSSPAVGIIWEKLV